LTNPKRYGNLVGEVGEDPKKEESGNFLDSNFSNITRQ
jgi:hypothetical protein